jgi:hypothetical protein
VHLAAIDALHVEDFVEAAAADAEALSSHAEANDPHVPKARRASMVYRGRECFITHLQGWERNPGMGAACTRSIGRSTKKAVTGGPEQCY